MLSAHLAVNNDCANEKKPMLDTTSFATIQQTEAHDRTSDKYAFVSTANVLEIFADHNWLPSVISEAASRKYRGYQKHLIRLRHSQFEFKGAGETPEIVLVNAHMGSSSFLLWLGLFRAACANGLILGEMWESFRIRHIGFTAEKVSQAILSLTQSAPKALDAAERFKAIELTSSEQVAYAESAIELVNDGEKFAMNPHDILGARRYEDRKSDLWTTFNRVQENVIKGGINRVNTLGRSRRTRQVKDIARNVDLNRALWSLTEKMAELKAN